MRLADEVDDAGHAADGFGVNLFRRIFSARRRRHHAILSLHIALRDNVPLCLRVTGESEKAKEKQFILFLFSGEKNKERELYFFILY